MTVLDDTGTSSLPDTTVDATTISPSSDSTFTPDTSGGSQAAPNPGENTASPPDAPVDDRTALLAVVQKVVQAEPKNPAGEGSAAAPDGSSTTETKPDAQAAADAAALEQDPTEEELKGMNPRTRARFGKLLEQRKAARQEAEALRGPAAKWQQMDGYLKKHDLAAEDANTLLGVGAHLRAGNFKAFLDGVMPYVELAQQSLGIVLPPALQAKVDAGEMTEEAAKQLSMTSIANTRLQGQVKAQTDATAAQRAAEQNAQAAHAVGTAISQWEQGVRARDPDYARKAAEVEAEAKLLIAANGPVKTVAEGIAIAERAYARVNRLIAAGRPAPVASQKQPSGARAVNGAKAEPKTLMEAAMAGLERARA